MVLYRVSHANEKNCLMRPGLVGADCLMRLGLMSANCLMRPGLMGADCLMRPSLVGAGQGNPNKNSG